ncbi:MAG TPA: type II toxin-antitoxin system PemK/MazF family toxin [Candidatus Acidoferrum sp.]
MWGSCLSFIADDPEVLEIEKEFDAIAGEAAGSWSLSTARRDFVGKTRSPLGAEIRKTRPCLVIATNIVNDHRRTVVVIPLSSAPTASPPLKVLLSREGHPSVAIVDQIRAVTKERFLRRIGTVSTQQLRAVEDGLRAILEL